MRVTVAGATGFVGRHVVDRLQGHCELVGLSRSSRSSGEGIDFKQCDLFSLLEVEKALVGTDVAVYLVHSMLPQARLTQGDFADLDVLLADNFARAARAAGVQRIIYLGAIVPRECHELSPHLASRVEVEKVLGSYRTPVVTLRAGLIVGSGGSSSDMLVRLVRRLPVMICPVWTRTMAQPVALGDVIELLARSILDDGLPSGAYDVAGPDRVTWVDVMRMTAQKLGVRRRFVPVSFFSVRLSLLWLRLVSGAPRELAAPLVESLRHPMLARDHYLFDRFGVTATSISVALDAALGAASNGKGSINSSDAGHMARRRLVSSSMVSRNASVSRLAEMRRFPRSAGSNVVCSVQRIRLARDEGASEIASRYAHWVVKFLRPWLHVEELADGSLHFGLVRPFGPPLLLLELSRSEHRSSAGREFFYITGGALVARVEPPGRFEFRRLNTGPEVIVAIQAFVPALPWQVYRVTQAPFHLWVMRAFARYVKAL